MVNIFFVLVSLLLTTLSRTDSSDVNHESINTTIETSSRIHIKTPATKEIGM